ncbi:MAG TPA: PHP domain-containing protein [Candidatus Limnocylindria bacterium]|nr:PHP domain-containing protein [Candidatus Limnocylindria bacterium]
MHTHTEFSPDSTFRLARYAERAASVGLGAVCVTDHNTIDGALRLREMDVPFTVIVGEEIYSRDGEIIGLYLTEAVPPHLPAEETIDRIHAQGGLAYIPHPFSRNRMRHLTLDALGALAKKIDAVEVFNAREIAGASNEKALAFAVSHGLPGGVGSDAHRRSELGGAFVEVDAFTSAQELLHVLRGGRVTGRLSGVGMHVRTIGDAIGKYVANQVRRLAGPPQRRAG